MVIHTILSFVKLLLCAHPIATLPTLVASVEVASSIATVGAHFGGCILAGKILGMDDELFGNKV